MHNAHRFIKSENRNHTVTPNTEHNGQNVFEYSSWRWRYLYICTLLAIVVNEMIHLYLEPSKQ